MRSGPGAETGAYHTTPGTASVDRAGSLRSTTPETVEVRARGWARYGAREGGGRPRREQAVEEDEAMKRAKEVIEKARSAKPAPKAGEPVMSKKDKEAVPA